MVKKETLNYKIIGIKNNKDIYGTLYNILQTRKIRKCIKVSKIIYIPIITIKKKTKLLHIWKPNLMMILDEKLMYTAMQGKPLFLIVNKDFDDYFTEFENIKIVKEVKNKELLRKLTKN